MRHLKKLLLAILALPALGSCAIGPKNSDLASPAGHHFAYRVPLRESVGLVQVFDDGSTTYLQFKAAPSDPVDIRQGSDETPIPYVSDGIYLKVHGVFDSLRVTVAEVSASVINEGAPLALGTTATNPPNSLEETPMNTISHSDTESIASVSPARVPGRAPVVGIPESLQTMPSDLRVIALKQEIASLEERVRELTAALDAAHAQGQAANLFARSARSVPRIVLTFDDNAFEARVEDHLADLLANAARSANRIYLHGHTDAYVASDAGTELAIRRTVEVRKILIARNVEPERIRLFYRGAGNFIANNSTPEGKSLNRRVEIEMRQW